MVIARRIFRTQVQAMSIDKIVSATASPTVAATSVAQPRQRSNGDAPPGPAKPAVPSLEAVAQRLETYMKSVSRSLEFRVDAGSGRTVISVRDSDTGELIRQIPSEEVLRLAQMAEDQTVVLVNEKV
jgi:flagellar protein FlaG